MIFKCDSMAEAERLASEIRRILAGEIINIVINEICGTVYLIVDGQLKIFSGSVLESLGVSVEAGAEASWEAGRHAESPGACAEECKGEEKSKLVFSIRDGKETYFVTDKNIKPDVRIGRRNYRKDDGLVSVIAGPCEIENYEDLYETAAALRGCGVSVFRAMPRKPRSTPYFFQGVGDIGWKYLERIRKELDMPVLAEVFSQDEIDIAMESGIDMIQIGARNMQNYDLIKRAARSGITTVLKKGMWCTNYQLLMAAEYFFVYGKGNVILMERGISTHENSTRNTMDLSGVRLLKDAVNLPVGADASHATGMKNLVSPMNEAAILMGADVIEVEVHIDPQRTIKPGDYKQILNIGEYKQMLEDMRPVMDMCSVKYDFE